ncbi:O-acyltransferase WSD1 isoform X1 [Citrus clementina]|uniref:O-acyltransferase WSD1 isoform X1 n=1 Tax=Citrus clementina TaxID=85681 RepID=UPI000CED7577|nr:O-acyltransferase WSD1 isoform X1 [Citrus x clementina]
MVNNGGKASSGDIYEEPLSPAALLFQAPNFNCHIIAIMGCKTSINPSVIKEGLQHTLIKHPRFSSKLVVQGRKKKWTRATVNVENHVIVPELDPKMENPDQFVEDYISYITTNPMDYSKPLWEVHLLNVKTSDAEAVGVFRIHHSIGDGASLISLLLACTRKTSDPEALPTIPVQKRGGSSTATAGWFCWWLLLAIWSAIRLIWNTIADLVTFLATVLFLKDTENPLKGGPGVELVPKRFVHRTIGLDDIKLVKNAMNMTINDVILGLTQAALSRYLHRRYAGDKAMQNGGAKRESNNTPPKNLRLRAAILVNLRPTTGIQALADMMAKESKGGWGNWIGYILLPFTIALQNDPLDYIRVAKATIDRRKHSLEAFCTFSTAKFVLYTFGAKVAAAIAHRVLSNTTMAFSNVVGPLEEISFYGHPMAYLAPSVYGHPHALTIHFQSYVNKMTFCVAVDPNVIPDPHLLCKDIEESLKVIKDCVVERGLIEDDAAQV